jgi:hypothetical protein
MLYIKDKAGLQHEVELGGIALHREAEEKKLTFRQLVNTKYPTASDQPETFKQMCVSAGMRFKADPETGRPASTMREILMGNSMEAATNQTGGTFTSAPGIPDSRILFPAAIMEAVESDMRLETGDAVSAFESLIAFRETIAGTRVEQPVIDFNGKGGPRDASFSRVAQNAEPNSVLSITAKDIQRTVPASAFMLEISDQALFMGVDKLTMTMAEFYRQADYNEWIVQLLEILQGAPDGVNTPMDNNTIALVQTKADTLDSTISDAGTITQAAWNKYFYSKSRTMVPDRIVTDYDAIQAVENRSGRPTNVMNNSMDRIDVPFKILYPKQAESVGTIVMPSDAGWPANTIMGLQSRSALTKVTSSSIDYTGILNEPTKRSTAYRFDRGMLIYRNYSEAFNTLSLTLTA